MKEIPPKIISSYPRRMYLSICECGKKVEVRRDNVKAGCVRSCGCTRIKTITKHGLSKTSLYRVWRGILRRVYDKTSKSYKNYGERGIGICTRWEKVENFVTDMRDTYQKGLYLERIDNNKGYSPENCKWVTIAEQNRNKGNNKWYSGKLLKDWAAEYNINYNTLYGRVSRQGWSLERALFTPTKCYKKRIQRRF